MILNIKFSSVFALFLFFLNFSGVSNDQKWIKGLTKHIIKDMQIYQTMLIISEDVQIQDKRISHVIEQFQQDIPSQIISLRHFTSRNTPIMLQAFYIDVF